MLSKLSSSLSVAVFSLILIHLSKCDWIDQPQIKIGYVTLYNSVPNVYYSSSTTPISYWIAFAGTDPLSAPHRAGASIITFHTYITNDFSINISLQNFTQTGIRITGKIQGDTMLQYLTVSYIAIGHNATFLQIMFDCHFCTKISTGKGNRTQNKTGVTSLAGYANLKVNVYLSGFLLHNSNGLTNYLAADASIISGSHIINYQFSVTQNNTVTQLCYTTIVFSELITQQQYYFNWAEMGSSVLPVRLPATNAFNFPALNRPDYNSMSRMFYGISSFELSRASRRLFYIDLTDQTSINTDIQANSGTFSVRVGYFWVVRRQCDNSHKYFDIRPVNIADGSGLQCIDNSDPCPSTHQIQANPGDYCSNCHYTCTTCDGVHRDNCTISCNATLFRQFNDTSFQCVCSDGYIDIGVPLCYPCQTFIPGCQTCYSTDKCFNCRAGFIRTSMLTCQCEHGHLVSGSCTNITGCTQLTVVGGTAYCTQCNASLNYQINSYHTCSCMLSYYLSINRQCKSRCGDGKKSHDQPCDDGNIVSGDGCSSTCTVQQNWICDGGSFSSASACYIDLRFQLVVKYVRRDTTANRMQIGLKIQPYVQQLKKINFQRYITHDMPGNILNAAYSDGLLVIVMDYSRTIQGEMFNMYVVLEPTVFYNARLSVSIPASGMNSKFTYDEVNYVNRPLEIIVIVLDALAIIVMFASCVSEKMIGIEMIQTIQTVLYTQSVMKTTPSSLSPLQMLRYSSGFNQIQGIDYTRTYTFAFSLSSIGLEKQFLLSYNLMYILLITVILVCMFFKIKQNYHQYKISRVVSRDQKKINRDKMQSAGKIYNFIFQRVLFLTAFMCMFLIVFALMLQMTQMKGDYSIMSKQFNILGGLIALAILSALICGVVLNGCFPGTLLFPILIKQYYPPIYFIYQSAFIFILATNYTQQYTLYILAGMSLIFLFFNLIYRPYPQKIHTFVLVFHQIFIMAVIGIYLYENLYEFEQDQKIYKILNGTIIGTLYLIVVINAYRIYLYYKFLKNKRWDQYGNPEKKFKQQNDAFFGEQNWETPKVLTYTRPNDQDYFTLGKEQKQVKTLRKDGQNQSQQLKSINKDKKPKHKLSSDEQNMLNWNYNSLADSGKINKTQLISKVRDVRPNLYGNQEQQKIRKRTKANEKEIEAFNDKFNNIFQEQNEQITVKDVQQTTKRLRSKTILPPPQKAFKVNKMTSLNYEDINQNIKSVNSKNNDKSNQSENNNNPYDQNGFIKSGKKPRDQYDDEDDDSELQTIKKKLKDDYRKKVKSSSTFT